MAKVEFGIDEILDLIPHRYPFLLVDRVLELSDHDIVAEKFVSANEPYFAGHFPGRPIMPGVLIIEAMAQAAAIGVLKNDASARKRGLVLAGVKKARFRKPVLPGSILTLHVTVARRRGDIFILQGVARVDSDTVAEAEFTAAFVDWED